MQRANVWVVACVVVALGNTACLSSSYQPRSTGRVAMMMRNNKVVLVRDGRVYEQGFFGGGLLEAVKGVPAAEGAALEFAGRRRSGVMVGLGGVLCSLVATGFMVGHAASEEDHDTAILTEGLIATGCLVVAYGGLWRLTSAEPYKYDAINLFNDAASEQSKTPPSSWDVAP